MQFKVWRQVEVDVSFVEICIPLDISEECTPEGVEPFGYRNGVLIIVVDIVTGAIQNCPEGPHPDIYAKVRDAGAYRLLDAARNTVIELNDYVPHGLIPGEYGDYIELRVSDEGIITNWPEWPNLRAFFPVPQ